MRASGINGAMRRLPLRLIGLAAILFVPTCGGDEATSEDIVAALCARADECRKTMRLEDCKKSLRHGCRDGKSFDGAAAHGCVQAIKTATCDQVTIDLPALPPACDGVCR